MIVSNFHIKVLVLHSKHESLFLVEAAKNETPELQRFLLLVFFFIANLFKHESVQLDSVLQHTSTVC